jgi:hypothetical protein
MGWEDKTVLEAGKLMFLGLLFMLKLSVVIHFV